MGRRQARSATPVLALACVALTAGCGLLGGSTGSGGTDPATSFPSSTSTAGIADGPASRVPSTTATTSPAVAASTTRPAATAAVGSPRASLRGKVVAIDPGHNGDNARHPSVISATVDVGNGTKACDTTGTETNAGYAEAAFTFDVSTRLAALLRARGATVVLTRKDNHGVGPCITERAAIGNRAHADAAISVHGDGAGADDHGFHVIVPAGIGSNDAIVAPSRRLGTRVRDAFRAGTGEPLSNYTATRTGGLVGRSDLGGLNLSQVPKVFIECGNMRNAVDARRMTSASWRQRAAVALAAGITRFLTS